MAPSTSAPTCPYRSAKSDQVRCQSPPADNLKERQGQRPPTRSQREGAHGRIVAVKCRLLPHVQKQAQRELPPEAASARADQRVDADGVGRKAMPFCILEDLQGLLPQSPSRVGIERSA